jgi:hypothetical protein
MSTTGNIKESIPQQEIKPHMLHNRMPPGLNVMGPMSAMNMTNCTPGNLMLNEGQGQDVQLLGHRFGYGHPYGYGYHHLYPYGGGYGYGYPFNRGCYPYGCRGGIWNYLW